MEDETKRVAGKDPEVIYGSSFIYVPRLKVTFGVLSKRRDLPNGRVEYPMLFGGADRSVSFSKRFLHLDEPGVHSYTYMGDGVVSSWDWKKDYTKPEDVIY